MGILDDAIREHLELKRSHGAPEEELRRQEVEALGVAHDEAIREDEDVDAARAAAHGQDPAEEDAPVPDFDHATEADFDPEALAAGEPEFEPSAEADVLEPPPAPAEPEVADLPEPEEEPPAFEPEPEPPPASDPPASRHGDTPTQGFDALAEDDDPFAEEPPAAEPAQRTEGEVADADLLEDTPDFLEETPEHDRLWFEQRPPRDFDFD